MHEVKVFGKDIFIGLFNALKTDIDVFLIATSALLWPLKIFRGFSLGLFFYVGCRRADGLMTAYQITKQRELDQVK